MTLVLAAGAVSAQEQSADDPVVAVVNGNDMVVDVILRVFIKLLPTDAIINKICSEDEQFDNDKQGTTTVKHTGGTQRDHECSE